MITSTTSGRDNSHAHTTSTDEELKDNDSMPRFSETLSIIACTQEDTFCLIDWNDRRVVIKDGGSVGFSYPFEKCSITSMWKQRSLTSPDKSVRRAVLVVKGFSEWMYTLAPECPAHDEPILSRLSAELHYCTSEVLEASTTKKDDHVVVLSAEQKKEMEERYSSNGFIQRTNLGPLTSEFLANFFEDRGKKKDQEEGTIKNTQDRELEQMTEKYSLSHLERESDQSWRDIELKPITMKNGRPWITMEDSYTFSDVACPLSQYKLKEVLCCSPAKKQKNKKHRKPEDSWVAELASIRRVRKVQIKGTDMLERGIVQPLTEFTNRFVEVVNELWETCTQHGVKQKFPNCADVIFSDKVLWDEEPIFPIQFYMIRHGQQLMSDSCGVSCSTPLSKLGKIQSIRTAELLYQWTQGFTGSRTLALLSSHLQRSKDTANLIWHAIKSLGGDAIIDECSRSSHLQLGEFLPQHHYQINNENNATDPSQLSKELDKDFKSQDEAYWILSAAFRALKGPLVPEPLRDEYRPTDLCGGPIKLLGLQQSTVQRYRFPPLTLRPESKILGIITGHSRTTKLSMENGKSVNLIYSGHGNTIKNFIIRELGLPRHLWQHVQIPHCSVIVMGIHHTGRPAILIADAGYLSMSSDVLEPLPQTFTPLIRSEGSTSKVFSHKNKLTTDQMVTLLPAEDSAVFGGIAGHPSIRYDRPLEPSKKEKHVLLLRAGHNAIVNCRDSGLTELGVQQLERASEWSCLLFKSGRLMKPPSAWCTAGLTSDWTSIDVTLKESLVIVKTKFKQHLGADIYDVRRGMELLLLQDDGTLNVIVADDYHLLKYFGACFGIDPLQLQYTYWPHAGHILITITESGWPELRTFGTISHLHPYQISILPGASEEKEPSKTKPSQKNENTLEKPLIFNADFASQNLDTEPQASLKLPSITKVAVQESQMKFQKKQSPPQQHPYKLPSLLKPSTPQPQRQSAVGSQGHPQQQTYKLPSLLKPSETRAPPQQAWSPRLKEVSKVGVTKPPDKKVSLRQGYMQPLTKTPLPPSPKRSKPSLEILSKTALKNKRGQPLDFRSDELSPSSQQRLSSEAMLSPLVTNASIKESRFHPPTIQTSVDAESSEEQTTEFCSPESRSHNVDLEQSPLDHDSFVSCSPEHQEGGIVDKAEGHGIVRRISYEPPQSLASEDSLDRRMDLEFAEQDKEDEDDEPFNLTKPFS